MHTHHDVVQAAAEPASSAALRGRALAAVMTDTILTPKGAWLRGCVWMDQSQGADRSDRTMRTPFPPFRRTRVAQPTLCPFSPPPPPFDF